MRISNRNYGKIDRTSGCGGFLCPPSHPEHTHSVRSSYGDTFFMSLTCAAYDSDWLNPLTRGAARGILKRWSRTKPSIDGVNNQKWVRQVLGYFAGCYHGANAKGEQSWDASDLRINKDADPMLNADIHAGVHCIRKYYPEFKPTQAQFDEAKWGK